MKMTSTASRYECDPGLDAPCRFVRHRFLPVEAGYISAPILWHQDGRRGYIKLGG